MKFVFGGLPPFSNRQPPPKCNRDFGVGGNSHISVATSRRAMVYSSNLRRHHVPICAKNKFFSIFNKKKVKAEKQKIWPFLVNLLENLPMRKGSHLTVLIE